MLDPISLSLNLISLVVPKLCDGMLEKFGADLGQKGVRKVHEMIGALKQSLRNRFQDKQDLLYAVDAEELSPTEIKHFQMLLSQQLTAHPEFLQDITQIQHHFVKALPELSMFFQPVSSPEQRIAEFMQIAGTLEIDSIQQDAGSSASQGILNNSTISETGKVKIGEIRQRGN
jgi:hypothetical protein